MAFYNRNNGNIYLDSQTNKQDSYTYSILAATSNEELIIVLVNNQKC